PACCRGAITGALCRRSTRAHFPFLLGIVHIPFQSAAEPNQRYLVVVPKHAPTRLLVNGRVGTPVDACVSECSTKRALEAPSSLTAYRVRERKWRGDNRRISAVRPRSVFWRRYQSSALCRSSH